MSNNYPANYQQKKYRPRDLTQRQMAYCEAVIAGYSSREAYKIAGYNTNHNPNLMKCKRIRDYIAKREGQKVLIPVTFEKKAVVLEGLMDATITNNIVDGVIVDKSVVNMGLDAIRELNKMQGHYAPEQSQSVNVNVNTTREKLKEAKKQYDEY